MRGIFAAIAALILATTLRAAEQKPPQPADLTPQFRSAGLTIDRLEAFEIGGVVIIKGRTTDVKMAEKAGRVAQGLGYGRVANLVQVIDAPDDAAIERLAERVLAMHRSLDGCTFRIDSQGGVLRVRGRVESELQKDEAIALLRTIDGVKEVHADLERR